MRAMRTAYTIRCARVVQQYRLHRTFISIYRMFQEESTIIMEKVLQDKLNRYNHRWQSQWLRGLRRRSAAAHLLRLWVRIPLGAWMSVCCECCVLSSRGLCDAVITSSEESYRLCCVVVCDLETSGMRRTWPALDHSTTEKKHRYL